MLLWGEGNVNCQARGDILDKAFLGNIVNVFAALNGAKATFKRRG